VFKESVPVGRADAARVRALLESPEATALCEEIAALRWTGRKGYSPRALVGACIVKNLYCLPTWTKTTHLIADHPALSEVLGEQPSRFACYRFLAKLRGHAELLERMMERLVHEIKRLDPALGTDIAIDGTDLPAYANGQSRLYHDGPLRARFSDPDASWGHRSAVSTRKGGGFYGYKLHIAVCTRSELPVALHVETGRRNEQPFALPLLDAVRRHGLEATTAAMDAQYDSQKLFQAFEERDCHPVVVLKNDQAVKNGDHEPPRCQHGVWTFAGADYRHKRTKWRCPTGGCSPGSRWIKASRLHPLIPYKSERWKILYRRRSAVEREVGRLKHDFGLLPLRVRGIHRVRVHVTLAVIARLASALDSMRATRLSHPAGSW